MPDKRRVLVVDDEPGVLRFISVSLTTAGYDVTTTGNGEEGIQLAESAKPDIILLDVVMVPLTGFDILEKIRAFPQVPVIVFTARGDIGAQAMKIGANSYIAKPFRPEELVKVIEDTLNPQKTSN